MQVMELYIIEEVGVVDIQQAIYLHIMYHLVFQFQSLLNLPQ